ncbi:MAG: hypothetical protein AABY15_06235 [Nanoarchaeota archaeon]
MKPLEEQKTKEGMERNIKGLILILKDDDEKGFIHRDYVIEKLERILQGTMNFHPSIDEALDYFEKSKVKDEH